MNKVRVVPEGTTKRYREGNFNASYTTLDELGRGRFAVVRKCKHKDTNRHFAAKFVRKRKLGRDCREDILKEIRILENAYSNQRLIGLHEVYETSSEVILVLEHAIGGELHKYCVADKEDAFSERDVVRLLRQILEAVHYLHKQNIAHLDLKPQNILLTSKEPNEGDIKLIDFGIARFLQHGEEVRDIQGTPDYVAPEILNYEPITLASDMWSVGVLTYVMLTGISPFAGDTKQETFLNISQVNLEFADEDFGCHSEEARDFIKRLCVKESEKRLTAEECLEHPWIVKFSSRDLKLDANDNVTQEQEEKCTISCGLDGITVDFVICKCGRRSSPSSQSTSCCEENSLDNRLPKYEPTMKEVMSVVKEAMSAATTEEDNVDDEKGADVTALQEGTCSESGDSSAVDDTLSDVDIHMECEIRGEQLDVMSNSVGVSSEVEVARSLPTFPSRETVIETRGQRRSSITLLYAGRSGIEITQDAPTMLTTTTVVQEEMKSLTCNRLHHEVPGGVTERTPTPSPSSSPLGQRRAFCQNKENSPNEIHEPKRFCLEVPAQQTGQVVC